MPPSKTKLLDMLEDATKAPHLIKTLACWRSHCKLAVSSELLECLWILHTCPQVCLIQISLHVVHFRILATSFKFLIFVCTLCSNVE